MDSTRRGNYDSGEDFVLEYGELRFTFNERDFAERVEQAGHKLGFVAARLDGTELEDLVNLTVNGEVSDPASALGGSLVYVRSTYRRQQLRIGRLAKRRVSRDRVLYSTTPTGRRDDTHEPGYVTNEHYPGGLYPRPPAGRSDTLWTTALGPGAAYVTRLRQRTGKAPRAIILRVTR